MSDHLPDPVDIGAPAKFTEWRDYQDEAVINGLTSEQRFVVQSMPTGSGKSLTYISQALLSGARTCVLTSTKGLQDQLIKDFSEAGLVDIRGKDNYACLHDDHPAPCHGWHIQSPHCEFHQALKAAQEAPLVVTNYSFWMNSMAYTRKENLLGAFDMLILDEAHNAPNELASFLGFEITRGQCKFVLGSELPHFNSIDDWRSWATESLATIEELANVTENQMIRRMQTGLNMDENLNKSLTGMILLWKGNKGDLTPDVKKGLKWLKRAEAMSFSLIRLTGIDGSSWVFERIKDATTKFDIINPAPYAEGSLFSYAKFVQTEDGKQRVMVSIPKIHLVSATVRPKTCDLLGIQIDSEDLDFQEYPHTFPEYIRPIIYVPTVRMKYNMSHQDQKIWLSRIDNIIKQRKDRKGIIHTVSYARRDFILTNSRHRDIMVSHSSGERDQVIKDFKEADAPCVLVSPSVATGFDFPYAECEYQIIGKVPWPSTQSEVMKARKELDPDYMNYIAAQELVQAAGRGTRAPDDQCEVFVVDDQFWWFVWRYKEFSPDWFRETVRKEGVLPRPPKSLIEA